MKDLIKNYINELLLTIKHEIENGCHGLAYDQNTKLYGIIDFAFDLQLIDQSTYQEYCNEWYTNNQQIEELYKVQFLAKAVEFGIKD